MPRTLFLPVPSLYNMPALYDHDHDNEVTLFAETNFRNQQRRFGIKTDDRRRHIYVLGKTGMGKTTLLENMVLSDIYAGHGVAYVDPHGDTAEKILDYIPSNRINDVVYFNPADMEYPVGFNILETTNDEQKHLVASGLMGVFKKIWPDVWSPRMEYILLNCVLALLDYPGATLLGINRLLVDKDYRNRVIAKIRNPIVKTFWVAEFTSWSEKYATEAIAPVQNKVGQFLSASIIRNIVAQVKSTIDPRKIMDEGKIFIVNLSKGKIGEDNMRLLGGMIVTKLQLAAMERVDIKHEADRRDFYLYVDEFQNFANQSFANILSEARKYRLNLVVAHQYIEQLEEEVRDAVFGNVGTMIIFRVGAADATYMETEFMPTFTPEDLTNLAKFQIYLKLMVDGVSTAAFSANTLAPIASKTGSESKVVTVSRERYAEPRAVIEEKVLRWSGMETSGMAEAVAEEAPEGPPGGDIRYPVIQTEEEQDARASLGGVPARLMPGTPEHALAGVAALEGQDAVEDTGEYLKISAERLAAITKPGQIKKEKPKFKHTCTRCGKVWEMPIQLDPSRPMYCAECMPLMREERKSKEKIMKSSVRSASHHELGLRPAEAERRSAPGRSGASLEDAMMALEEGKPITRAASDARGPAQTPRAENNRPRLVVTDKDQLERLNDEEDEDHSELLADVARTKGRPVETRKQMLTPPKPPSAMARREPPSPPRHRDDRPRQPDKRQDKRDQRPKGQGTVRIVQPSQSPRGERMDGKPRRSVEDIFREAEERVDQQFDRPAATKEDSDRMTTVFRKEDPPTPPASAHGPRPIAPGQRVRFDES